MLPETPPILSTSMPPNPSMQPALPQPPRSSGRGWLVATIGLGVLVLVLAVLAAVEFSASAKSKAILDSANQKAYSNGQTDQKKSDDEKNQLANEAPYRSYLAPSIYGGFEIAFPKNWNAYVVESEDGSQQVNMTVNPDFVKLLSGKDNSYALHVILQRSTFAQLTSQHADDVKQGKVKMSTVTVSGISSSRYEGKFDGKHDSSSTVLVPVRDKTIIISTDNNKQYGTEFNRILAQSKIAP